MDAANTPDKTHKEIEISIEMVEQDNTSITGSEGHLRVSRGTIIMYINEPQDDGSVTTVVCALTHNAAQEVAGGLIRASVAARSLLKSDAKTDPWLDELNKLIEGKQ